MMKPSPSQPEYYGWYPDTTIPGAFAKAVWDAIIESEALIEFSKDEVYRVKCPSNTDTLVAAGLFQITKPDFRVKGNNAVIEFEFDAIYSSTSAIDGAPMFKWILPSGITRMGVKFQNITLRLAEESIHLIDETFDRWNGLQLLQTVGTENEFHNVHFLDFPNVGDELGARINSLSVSRNIYQNCTFRYGGSNHDNCLYIQGETKFEECWFDVKRKYSSHAIYWGLDRNDVVVRKCKFSFIGGYYLDNTYEPGQDRTGTVLSWRGTSGSGIDARGLKFINNEIQNSGRTLIGFDSGPYANTIHRDALIVGNTWVNCGSVQFDNQHNGVFTKNTLIKTLLSIDNCVESRIVDNPKIGNVVWSENVNVEFISNFIDDEEFDSSQYFIPADNVGLKILNNQFRFKFRQGDPTAGVTLQWMNNQGLIFQNNRIEIWNNPAIPASISWRSSFENNKILSNIFINCYNIFRINDLVFTGVNEIKNNMFINNSMPSSQRVLENSAAGPFTAQGNEVVNGTFIGTLNNS